MKEIAIQFGQSLDQDDFEKTKTLLHENCQYDIGEKVLVGPQAICNSYEQNMLDGHRKMDKLEWGKSTVERINELEYFVHFTDYLTHKNQTHIHRCKQQLSFDKAGKIIKIKHINNQEEQEKLQNFYRSVGIIS